MDTPNDSQHSSRITPARIKAQVPPELLEAFTKMHHDAFKQLRESPPEIKTRIRTIRDWGKIIYECRLEMFPRSYEDGGWGPRLKVPYELLDQQLQDEIKAGNFKSDIRANWELSEDLRVGTLIITGADLEEVMKVACDMYIKPFGTGHMIDYKGIIDKFRAEQAAGTGPDAVPRGGNSSPGRR